MCLGDDYHWDRRGQSALAELFTVAAHPSGKFANQSSMSSQPSTNRFSESATEVASSSQLDGRLGQADASGGIARVRQGAPHSSI